MGNKKAPTRSFNTVKHSNREQRVKRKQNQRIILLAMGLVIILLVLSLLTFGVFSLVDLIKNHLPDEPTTEDTPPTEDQPMTMVSVPMLNTDVAKGELILINGDHSYDPAKAENLQQMHGNQAKNGNGVAIYYLAKQDYKLNETALAALNQMMLTYHNVSDGDLNIKVGSAYRTAEDQSSFSTPVGHSDHHSGYCLTLMDGNASLSNNHWIYENCHKYGFVVRYPEGKEAITGVSGYEWCFRYVGVAHATYMKANNLCLEEYVDLLKNSYTNAHLTFTGIDGNQYEVYYVPASTSDTLTTLQVPSGLAYSISGDNAGGFIVTVNRSKPVA